MFKPSKSLVIFVLIAIMFTYTIFQFLTAINKSKDDYFAYFANFLVEFKGILVEKKKLDHNRAQCKIKIISTNTNYHVDSGILWWRYCDIKNDTAFMQLTDSHSLQLNDTIIIGPNDRYIIKRGNDTILNFYNKRTH